MAPHPGKSDSDWAICILLSAEYYHHPLPPTARSGDWGESWITDKKRDPQSHFHLENGFLDCKTVFVFGFMRKDLCVLKCPPVREKSGSHGILLIAKFARSSTGFRSFLPSSTSSCPVCVCVQSWLINAMMLPVTWNRQKRTTIVIC